jgi:hypothetical protein
MKYARALCIGLCSAFFFRELWASDFLDPLAWIACVAFAVTWYVPPQTAAKSVGRGEAMRIEN